MGTILASTLIAQASEQIEDSDQITWTPSQILGWLNDGQRMIVEKRPDANAAMRTVLLAQGSMQTISGLRLLDVICNMGSAGSTPGRAVRRVRREDKDLFSPNWRAETKSGTIKEYMFDEASPRVFHVSPPAATSPNTYLRILQSEVPAEITNSANPITLEDIWAPHLIEWMLFRMTERGAETNAATDRANSHFLRFSRMLKEKLETDALFSPKNRGAEK